MTDPWFILELTTRCNLDCIFCYNVWKPQNKDTHKDLSLSELKSIIETIEQSTSIQGITLAGGEPLLNKEIVGMAEYLHSKNIKTSVTTNGILLVDETVKQLVQCGIDRFEISMPSINDPMYRKLCRSDSLIQVRAAILNARKYDIKLCVSNVLTKLNYEEVYDTVELSAVFGADEVTLNRFVPGGTGLGHANDLSLSNGELKFALGEADRAAQTFGIPVIVAIPVEHCQIDTSIYTKLHFGTCLCGAYKWTVDPFGNLRTCEQNPTILGSLFDTGFDHLSHLPSVSEFRNNDLHPDCKTKPCYTVCGGGCRFCR
jgi:radical SAM protein with 4Fe4S-binding SPASM domain